MAGKIENMYLINAPAGSGKTTFIESKIMNIIVEKPNIKILCITYTNRAAEELNLRINNSNVKIQTIHSFISEFIKLYFSNQKIISLFYEVYESQIESNIKEKRKDGGMTSKNKRYIDKYGQLNLETIKSNIEVLYYNELQWSGWLSLESLLILNQSIHSIG